MTGSLPIAFGAGIGAATCFGVATTVQHLETRRVRHQGPPSPRLLGDLARRRLWLLSFVAEGVAIGLQAVALRFGPVAVVQPLIVAGLPAAVLLSVLLGARRLSARAAGGLALCTAGIASFAPSQPTTNVAADIPATRPALLTGAAGTTLIMVLLRGTGGGRWAGVTAGASAGVAIGAGSVLLAICAAHIDRPGRLLSSWPPYALAAVGLVGLVLAQSAFQTGALGPPLASLTVLEPVTAALLAAVLLHQRGPTSEVDVVVACSGAVVATVGVLLLIDPKQAAAPPGWP